MGRNYYGDVEGKFWFACQSTSDLLEFGCEETPESVLRVCVPHENLKKVEDKVIGLKDKFKKKFKVTFEEFMKKMEKKGYLSSTKDKETLTTNWDEMCKDASLIELGSKILTALKVKKDDLFIEGEC